MDWAVLLTRGPRTSICDSPPHIGAFGEESGLASAPSITGLGGEVGTAEVVGVEDVAVSIKSKPAENSDGDFGGPEIPVSDIADPVVDDPIDSAWER